jgi:LysM repeat protein
MFTGAKKTLIPGLILAALMLFLLSSNIPAQASPPLQLTPFPTPTPGPDGRILYTVQSNDTLLRISLISGVSIEELRALNNFTGDNIQVGQQLLLGLAGPSEITPTAGPSPTATAILPTPSPKPGFGEICVSLFDDTNGDSIRQGGEVPEEPITGGAISVGNDAGTVSLTAETDGSINEDETDAECFRDLPEGEYSITVGVPDGHNPTTVTSYAIALNAGDKIFIDFGVQKNSEAEAQAPPPEGDGRNPVFGIVGGVLLAAGLGLAIFAGRLLKAR